ncbi:hypothetical protein [Bacillus methanolicus]|nr:hypothetical protein [Bacillus methanolicus]
MKDTIKYVGLDVSKEKIAVAIAEEGRKDPVYWGFKKIYEPSITFISLQ